MRHSAASAKAELTASIQASRGHVRSLSSAVPELAFATARTFSLPPDRVADRQGAVETLRRLPLRAAQLVPMDLHAVRAMRIFQGYRCEHTTTENLSAALACWNLLPTLGVGAAPLGVRKKARGKPGLRPARRSST